jgi:hypothetical protein
VREVETELRLTDSGSCFVVRTADPAFKEALTGLAYAGSGDAFTRWFSADAPDLDRIYRNFELEIEELLEQTAGRRPVPWERALHDLADRLEHAGVEWFLSGSSALAVRGLDQAPRDVDFVASDHAAVAEALADALIEPPLYDRDRQWIARWFGRAFLGARVEWLADVYPDIDEWGVPNEIGPSAAAQLERVRWEGESLLLTPLDAQLAVNADRGLTDRVEAIRRFQGPTRLHSREVGLRPTSLTKALGGHGRRKCLHFRRKERQESARTRAVP